MRVLGVRTGNVNVSRPNKRRPDIVKKNEVLFHMG